MLKNGLIRKVRLILKFIPSQYYCPISHEVKTTNQTMKFGQLIENSNRNIFLQKPCKNKVGRLVPELFFSQKSFILR